MTEDDPIKAHLKRAYRDTRNTVTSSLPIFLVLGVVAALIAYALNSDLVANVAAPASIFVVAFLWKLVSLPYRQVGELSQEIAALKQERSQKMPTDLVSVQRAIEKIDEKTGRNRTRVRSPSDDAAEHLIELFASMRELQAQAQLGNIRVFGRKPDSSRYEEIEPSYWIEGGLDASKCFNPQGTGGETSCGKLLLDFQVMTGLKVSRSEFEKVFGASWTETT